MTPSTSVVICSRGRPRLLLDAVTSVLAMSQLPTELVIVDQSDEPQADLAAGKLDTTVAISYLWSPDRGVSRARNAGVAAAGGDLVAFIDDDMLVDRDWLGNILSALTAGNERRDRCVVSGQVPAGRPEVPGAWAPSTISDSRARSYSGRIRADVLFAGNMALHRSVFDLVGTFDERLGPGTSLPSAEDNDFCYRLLQAGLTIEYRPEVVAVHRAWRSKGALARLKYDYGRGQGGFYVKHMSSGDWFMVRRFAADAYRHLVRAAIHLLRARLLQARSDLAYTGGLVVGAFRWRRIR